MLRAAQVPRALEGGACVAQVRGIAFVGPDDVLLVQQGLVRSVADVAGLHVAAGGLAQAVFVRALHGAALGGHVIVLAAALVVVDDGFRSGLDLEFGDLGGGFGRGTGGGQRARVQHAAAQQRACRHGLAGAGLGRDFGNVDRNARIALVHAQLNGGARRGGGGGTVRRRGAVLRRGACGGFDFGGGGGVGRIARQALDQFLHAGLCALGQHDAAVDGVGELRLGLLPQRIAQIARVLVDQLRAVGNHAGGLYHPVGGGIEEAVHLVLHGGVPGVAGVHGERKADEDDAGRQGDDAGEQLGQRAPAQPAPPQQQQAHGPDREQQKQREQLVEEARAPAAALRGPLAAAGVPGGGAVARALFGSHHVVAPAGEAVEAGRRIECRGCGKYSLHI